MTLDRMSPVMLSRHLGSVARQARLAARVTQEETAERVRMSTEVYGRLERGNMLPSVRRLRELCQALGMDANAALGLGEASEGRAARLPEQAPESPRRRRALRSLRALNTHLLDLLGRLARMLLRQGASAGGRDAAR